MSCSYGKFVRRMLMKLTVGWCYVLYYVAGIGNSFDLPNTLSENNFRKTDMMNKEDFD